MPHQKAWNKVWNKEWIHTDAYIEPINDTSGIMILLEYRSRRWRKEIPVEVLYPRSISSPTLFIIDTRMIEAWRLAVNCPNCQGDPDGCMNCI